MLLTAELSTHRLIISDIIWVSCVRCTRKECEKEGGFRANMPCVFTSHILPGMTRLHSLRLSVGRESIRMWKFILLQLHVLCCMTLILSLFQLIARRGVGGDRYRKKKWCLNEHRLGASLSCEFELVYCDISKDSKCEPWLFPPAFLYAQ